MALLDKLNDHDADADAGYREAGDRFRHRYGDFRTWMDAGQWYWQVQVLEGIWMPQDGQRTAMSDEDRETDQSVIAVPVHARATGVGSDQKRGELAILMQELRDEILGLSQDTVDDRGQH